ncbi:aspartyl protease family protein At5g10770-like [Panicum virgatum]|uniref:aspartyl protease family protein At5g10770-like n=1 Tax=Panicum virgatum TaxID=38727 RepID=UPI0019D6481E|nr:aspartyl protease family protein At5g10770-like [Panicum virgatum]
MGLGGGPESLVSQTAASHGNAFSYCVPTTASDSGFFVLGAPAPGARGAFVTTPLLRNPRVPTFYRVLLRDIAVGGRRLNVPAAALAAGSVVDSRTVITRLPPTAYQALRAAFRGRMGAYRPAPPRGSLDTCYNFAGVFVVRVPRVALVFDGNAVVELDPSGILFNDCLAFAPTSGDGLPGVIGNVQQRTIEVLYDVGGGAVGFRRGAC